MAKATAKGKMAKKPSGGGKAPRKRPAANVDVFTVDDDYSHGTICSDCLKYPETAVGWLHCDHRDCNHIVCFKCILKNRLMKKNFMSCTHCNAWPSRR